LLASKLDVDDLAAVSTDDRLDDAQERLAINSV
jgi:hypothetical protein